MDRFRQCALLIPLPCIAIVFVAWCASYMRVLFITIFAGLYVVGIEAASGRCAISLSTNSSRNRSWDISFDTMLHDQVMERWSARPYFGRTYRYTSGGGSITSYDQWWFPYWLLVALLGVGPTGVVAEWAIRKMRDSSHTRPTN